MVATRSMSGTTKKADTEVAVNHKVAEKASKKTSAERASKKTTTAERASKKTTAKGERARKRNERYVMEQACEYFIKETFMPQYKKVHPGTKTKVQIMWAGEKEWASMTDSDKAPYVAVAEKRFAEQMAHYELYMKGECSCHR